MEYMGPCFPVGGCFNLHKVVLTPNKLQKSQRKMCPEKTDSNVPSNTQ